MGSSEPTLSQFQPCVVTSARVSAPAARPHTSNPSGVVRPNSRPRRRLLAEFGLPEPRGPLAVVVTAYRSLLNGHPLDWPALAWALVDSQGNEVGKGEARVSGLGGFSEGQLMAWAKRTGAAKATAPMLAPRNNKPLRFRQRQSAAPGRNAPRREQ